MSFDAPNDSSDRPRRHRRRRDFIEVVFKVSVPGVEGVGLTEPDIERRTTEEGRPMSLVRSIAVNWTRGIEQSRNVHQKTISLPPAPLAG